MGVVLQKQGHFKEAVKAYEESAEIKKTTGDKLGLAITLNSLGGVQADQGNFDEAVKNLQLSVEIGEQLVDKKHLAMALISLGELLHKKGWLDKAVKAFERSVEIEKHRNNKRGLAMALNSLGRVEAKQGNIEEAVKNLKLSGEIKKDIGDLSGQAIQLHSLGAILLKYPERFAEAVDALKDSKNILTNLGEGDKRGLAMVHTSLGKALFAHGETQKAIIELYEGFKIDESLKNRYGLDIVAPLLIKALRKLRRHEEALAYCHRAIAVSPKNQILQELLTELSSFVIKKNNTL